MKRIKSNQKRIIALGIAERQARFVLDTLQSDAKHAEAAWERAHTAWQDACGVSTDEEYEETEGARNREWWSSSKSDPRWFLTMRETASLLGAMDRAYSSDLDATAKSALVYLLHLWSSDDPQPCPSVATIAGAIGKTGPTVQKALAGIHNSGLAIRLERVGDTAAWDLSPILVAADGTSPES